MVELLYFLNCFLHILFKENTEAADAEPQSNTKATVEQVQSCTSVANASVGKSMESTVNSTMDFDVTEMTVDSTIFHESSDEYDSEYLPSDSQSSVDCSESGSTSATENSIVITDNSISIHGKTFHKMGKASFNFKTTYINFLCLFVFDLFMNGELQMLHLVL